MRRGTPSQKVVLLPGYLLFFLMLVFPMVIELLYVKAALFALLLLLVSLSIIRSGRIALDPMVGIWSLGLAATSMFFVLTGLFAGAPGALKQAQVYVLFPLVYTVLISGTARWEIVVGLQRVVVIATVVSSLYAILFVLTSLGVIPDVLFVGIFTQGQSITLHRGYVEFRLFSLNTFPFLVPFVLAALALPSASGEPGTVSRSWLWIALSLSLVVVAVSGRRGLWAVTLMALGFVTVLRVFESIGRKPYGAKRRLSVFLLGLMLVATLLVLLLRTVYSFEPDQILGSFTDAFGPARQEQLAALLNGWSDHPILGAGHGSVAVGSVRSETMPWSYELYYVALLYQTGTAGLLLYGAGLMWLYWMGVRILLKGGPFRRLMFPALIGLSCFLIATTTNPYLARFDGIWVVFYPLAIINLSLLQPVQPPPSPDRGS